jgi:hypothetical protein
VETVGRHRVGRHELEQGGRSGAGACMGRTTACISVCEPAVLRPLKAGAAAGDGFGVWAGSLEMRVRTSAGAPGRRTGDGPLVHGVLHGGSGLAAFPVSKASGGA